MNDMVDMGLFVEAKSDQLNSDDLLGGPRTITVTRVTGAEGDQPVSIHYQGDNGKPFKPCKTMRRVLLAIWGRNAADYVGRSMTVYRDDAVTFGGLNVGGIRISHMSGIDKETVVVVMKTKGKKAGIKILPLRVEQQRQEPQEDPARKWTDNFLANVKKTTVADALDALILRVKNNLDGLRDNRPELHVECEHAIATAREGFAIDHQEKRSDDQHGDQFDGTDPAA